MDKPLCKYQQETEERRCNYYSTMAGVKIDTPKARATKPCIYIDESTGKCKAHGCKHYWAGEVVAEII